MITITTTDGSRVIRQARVTQDKQDRDRSAVQARAFETAEEDAQVVVLGDGGIKPSDLVVEVQLQEGTNSFTGAVVQQIINEAKNATSVETARGVRLVDGISRHRLSHNGQLVTLGLHFIPTKGTYEV